MVIQAVHMIPQLGEKLRLLKSTLCYLMKMNGYGQIPHIRYVVIVPDILHCAHAIQIDVWITAPYKKPDSDLADNEIFNNHVSMLRIRSEHAIGFLKGRF